MIASIAIVILAVLLGSLSIFAQYTKDRERRKKIERAVSIPAALALYSTIAWLMSHAHQLDDLGVSTLALVLALVFFLLIPAVTYIFSPAFKDGPEEDARRPQPHTSEVSHP
jgi:2-methylisocitrate lyase-like PEP mutase family enzyme